MLAMIRIVPPQAAQVSMSIQNTRFERCAQRIDPALGRRGHIGFGAARPALAPSRLRDQCPVRTVGREHIMVAGEIHLRPGHQGGQPEGWLSCPLLYAAPRKTRLCDWC